MHRDVKLTKQTMNRSRQVVAVQGVETQVGLLVMASLPNLCVSNDRKFNWVPQRHRQAAVLSQPEVHTGGEIKKKKSFDKQQDRKTAKLWLFCFFVIHGSQVE